jgi:hypothetical protein
VRIAAVEMALDRSTSEFLDEMEHNHGRKHQRKLTAAA